MRDTAHSRPALFLDRDGVINQDTGYLYKIEDCRFVEGVFDLAHRFARRGYAIVIITNQSGIGRGLYGETEFRILMDWMCRQFALRGTVIAGVYHAPEDPTKGQSLAEPKSGWRKPGPGMFLQAAADLNLALPDSWCVGDKLADIEAGRAAGIRHLVLFYQVALRHAQHKDFLVSPTLDSIG